MEREGIKNKVSGQNGFDRVKKLITNFRHKSEVLFASPELKLEGLGDFRTILIDETEHLRVKSHLVSQGKTSLRRKNEIDRLHGEIGKRLTIVHAINSIALDKNRESAAIEYLLERINESVKETSSLTTCFNKERHREHMERANKDLAVLDKIDPERARDFRRGLGKTWNLFKL